jgi:DNA-binding XRE family transcriptional regulator
MFMEDFPKDVENRTWKIPLGPLAIHAGLSRQWMYWGRHDDELKATTRSLGPWDDLPFGKIIGVVDVVEHFLYPEPLTLLNNPWAFGPICNMLSNPRPLFTPVPWKGLQKIFKIPDSVILEQMPGMEAPGPGITSASDKHPRAKMDSEKAWRVMEMYHVEKKTQKEIAGAFEVSTSTICKILRGETWPEIREAWFERGRGV